MLDDLIYESSFVQELLEEGEIKGKRQMAQEMAQVALEGRFGALSDDVLAALTTADEATLRAIVAHITTDSLDAVRARLGLE